MSARNARFNWTPERVQTLLDLYPDNCADVVAEQMGCTLSAIYNKAHALGLHKSEAFKASGRITRGTQHPSMVASRFKQGMEPWNKGVPGSTGLHPNCRATQFTTRPPEQARNYKTIGSLRVTRDGILERKVTDDTNVYPARRWVSVARLVWELAYGPIPAKHIVAFKPGMKTTTPELITIDRLECISRAQNAIRNHPKNKHPELARLVQLKGAITRQVNRIKQHAQEASHAD